jgi:hypothetical protein
MPFHQLLPPDNRLAFHTELYLAFRERGRLQQIQVQVNNAIVQPAFWLDDLNFGARFGPRGALIANQLNNGIDRADINLPNDHENPTGCTFVSGLAVANAGDPVWQAPLALALGMKPKRDTDGQVMQPGCRGRFMVQLGTKSPIWLGHTGGLAGGGAGVITINEFHILLPGLQEFLNNNPQPRGLIPGLELAFGQVFAHNFVPDDLIRPPPQGQQSVFPIAAYDGTEKFFQTLASYVHQCCVLRRLRQEGII